MKVRLEFTVEVDPEAWILNYGIPLSEVRQDVKNYCESLCHEQINLVDCGVDQ